MWNPAIIGSSTAFLIAVSFSANGLAEPETAAATRPDESGRVAPDATHGSDSRKGPRRFESPEEFEAALRAHIEAERAAAWEKAHPPGRRTAAEMMGAPPVALRVAPPPPSAQEFREWFEAKSEVSDIQVDSDQRGGESPGKFMLVGDFSPTSMQLKDQVLSPSAESIAAAFLLENAALFGIVDLNDLALYYTGTGPTGWSQADYRREIGGLRLTDSRITFEIDPDGHIRRIRGNLPAVPEELYAAVQRPILTEEEARKLTTRELLGDGRVLLSPIRPMLILESAPPYVMWRTSNTSPGDDGLIYSNIKIDAATGETIEYSKSKRHLCH